MKKKDLTILNAGIAFVVSFILSQFTLAIGTSITTTILSGLGRNSAQIDAFFKTSVGYLLKSIYLNIAFVAVFIWYFKSIDKQDFIQKPNKSILKYSAIGIILGVASFFLLSGVVNHFEWFVTKIGYSSDTDPFTLNSVKDLLICYVSLALIPAVCEELLFRGVIINCLKHKGQVFAVVLSSIMFSIFHFSPIQLIYPLCWGLLLGIVYLRTKNIIFPMIMHFINNALSLTLQFFISSSEVFKPTIFLTTYTIITFIIWIFAMIYLFKDFIRHNEKSQNSSLANISSTNNTENTIVEESANTNNKLNQSNNTNDNMVFYGSIAIMLCIYLLLLFA